MPLAPIDLSKGQNSGVDDFSDETNNVTNWQTDETGYNRVRPGLTSYADTGPGTLLGLNRWRNYVVSVASDRKIWTLEDATLNVSTNRSSVAGSTVEGAARPVFARGDDFMYVTGGVRIQKWGPSLADAETLTNSPPCTHVVNLGQRLVANDTSAPTTFRWSAQFQGNFNTWDAGPSVDGGTDFGEGGQDIVVGIYENLSELFVFGRETVRVFGNGNDPTNPYEVSNTFSLGLGAPYGCIRLDQQFAIFDDKRRVSITNGRQVEPISAPIGRDLRNLSVVSDCFGYREEKGQQSYLVFRFPTAKRTFTFDLKNTKWGERDYYDVPNGMTGADWPMSDAAYREADNRYIVASSLSGISYGSLDETARTDFGAPIWCKRLTGWQDFGALNRKRSVRVRIILRRGTATENTIPGTLEVRVQDDDSGWSPWATKSIGTPSDFAQPVDFFFGGIFRRRRYEFRYSNTDVTTLAEAVEDYRDLST